MNIFVFHERSLTTNLSADFVVRQTSSGEEWDLLSSSDGVHDVYGGDTRLDHFLGVLSLVRIDWLALKSFKSFIIKYHRWAKARRAKSH